MATPIERVTWWWRTFKDTRGYNLGDRLALTWLSRGRRGGWAEVDGGMAIRVWNR